MLSGNCKLLARFSKSYAAVNHGRAATRGLILCASSFHPTSAAYAVRCFSRYFIKYSDESRKRSAPAWDKDE
jgi:hypothetical protein